MQPTLLWWGQIWHTSGNSFSCAASNGYLYHADVGALGVYRILP